ncbi:MAG: tetratricopeptide repeat protein [Cyclobacteriaceae bacterium]
MEDYKKMGLQSFEAKNYSKSSYYFQKVVELYPNDLPSMYNLARSLEETGDYEKSKFFYSKVLKKQRDMAEAYMGRGRCYWQDSMYYEARIDFNNTVFYNPRLAEGYYLLGMAQIKLGEFEEAAETLSICLQLDEDNFSALYHRGIAKASTGYLYGATRDFSRVIKADNEFVKAYHSRSKCFLAMKMYPQALSDINKTIELNGPSEAYITRAFIYLQLNEKSLACKDLFEAKKRSLPNVNKIISDHCK